MASAKATLESEIAATRAMGVPTTPEEVGAIVAGNGGLNAAPYYVAAMDAQRGTSTTWIRYVGEGATPVQKKNAVLEMREHATVLSRIEQATAIEKCDFQREWGLGWELPLPEYTHMRRFAELLRARAVLAAERGRTDVALSDLGRMLRISEHIASDPTPIAFHVAHSVVGEAARTTQLLAATYQNDPVVLERIKNIWERASTLDMERSLGSVAPSFRDGLNKASDPRFWARSAWMERGVEYRWTPFLTSQPTVRMGAEIKLLRGHREALRAIREERDPRARLDRLNAIDSVLAEDRSASALLANMMAPLYGSIGHAALKLEAMRRIRVAALDLMIDKAQGGLFPATLPDSVIDPYDGRPLRYSKEPRGFLLYSTGWNRDALGRTRGEQIVYSDMTNGEDLVWRFPPPARRNAR